MGRRVPQFVLERIADDLKSLFDCFGMCFCSPFHLGLEIGHKAFELGFFQWIASIIIEYPPFFFFGKGALLEILVDGLDFVLKTHRENVKKKITVF